jgi:hypothetical protein
MDQRWMDQRWESQYLIARWLFGDDMLAEARGESATRVPREEPVGERGGRIAALGRIASLARRLASRSASRGGAPVAP